MVFRKVAESFGNRCPWFSGRVKQGGRGACLIPPLAVSFVREIAILVVNDCCTHPHAQGSKEAEEQALELIPSQNIINYKQLIIKCKSQHRVKLNVSKCLLPSQ